MSTTATWQRHSRATTPPPSLTKRCRTDSSPSLQPSLPPSPRPNNGSTGNNSKEALFRPIRTMERTTPGNESNRRDDDDDDDDDDDSERGEDEPPPNHLHLISPRCIMMDKSRYYHQHHHQQKMDDHNDDCRRHMTDSDYITPKESSSSENWEKFIMAGPPPIKYNHHIIYLDGPNEDEKRDDSTSPFFPHF